MAGDNRNLSTEEALALLSEKAKSAGDFWRVKVYRRRGPGHPQESVATFDDARVEHFANPEMWLPKVVGGAGERGASFVLAAYHMTDTVNALVQGIHYPILGAPKVDRDNKPTYDFEAMKSPLWNGPTKLVWPEPADMKMETTITIPFQSPLPGVNAPMAPVPQNTVPGGATNPGNGLNLDALRTQLEFERSQLFEKSRALEESRHKMEMEQIKRENDARFREMEARLAQPAVKQAGLVELLPAVLPMVQAIISSNNEMRKVMFEAQQDSAKQTTQLLVQLMEKKTEETPGVKMLSQVTEAMGSMSKMMIDSMKAQMDALNGPEEPNNLKIVREVVKGISTVASGISRPKLVPVLPGQNPQAPRPQPQMNGAPAQRPPVQRPVPQPQQVTQPKQQVPQAAETQPQMTIVDQIDHMIRQQMDVGLVATQFIKAIDDPAMNDALRKVGGDPVELFRIRLGDWVDEDQENRGGYVLGLSQELQRQLTEKGLLEQPSAESEEDAELAGPEEDEDTTPGDDAGDEDERAEVQA